MKNRILTVLLVCVSFFNAASQDNKIKNVILMIPDGTSLALVSTARWYQRYNDPQKPNLHIDPYICGTVLTYSSNAPIGDSAPTTSTYMTGYPSQAGYVSTYPVADPENDIIPMDATKAYQPLMTVFEAARITQRKAVGLVMTCEFPHATPADCMAHSYNRSAYKWLVPQMVHNGIDVVIGGGASLLTPEQETYLQQEGYSVFRNDLDNFRNYPGNKMWALYAEKDMAYEIDRDPAKEPSLAEMTAKAIEKLSTAEEGFVLMVEGSKIDWAAHANDAGAMIHDMLAFDEACGVALDFARKDGETLVVIVPDHGNSGISLGSSKCPSYGKLTKDQLFGPLSSIKSSVGNLIERLKNTPAGQLKAVFAAYTGMEITEEEYDTLLKCRDYNSSGLSDEERMYGSTLSKIVSGIIDRNICLGFTTGGHTGEEVFLAILDPSGNRLMGHHTNIELNHYLRRSLGLSSSLEELTGHYFAKHTDVFEGFTYSISEKDKQPPVLIVKHKKKELRITPNTRIVSLNKKDIQLESVVVYVDKNHTFYLPQSLRELLQ